MTNNDEIQTLRDLTQKIDAECMDFIKAEMSHLEQISQFSQCIEKRLKELYAAKFPKKCNNCNRIYQNRSEYLKATLGLRQGTLFEESLALLQEYRNCVCGSTLVIITEDRRDDTEFGRVRRELFLTSLKKLAQITAKPESDLVAPMREVFRKIIEISFKEPDLLDISTELIDPTKK